MTRFGTEYVVFKMLSKAETVSLEQFSRYITEISSVFPQAILDVNDDSLSLMAYQYATLFSLNGKGFALSSGTSTENIQSFARMAYNWMHTPEDDQKADEAASRALTAH
jgi:hypothetical protein